MSMQIYLLSDRDAPSMEELQQSIDGLSLDVRLVTWQTMPSGEKRIEGESLGKPVEMVITPVKLAYLRNEFPDVLFPEKVSHLYALHWAMSFAGSAAAYQTAAAFIHFSKGLMIDTEEAKLKTPDQALKLAREMALEMPALEAAVLAMATKLKPKRSN